MYIEKMQLREDSPYVYLDAYIHDNSKEFLTDKARPAVIICPGGGYLGTSDREAEPVALRFASLGYQVFVLRYTTYYNEPVTDYLNLPAPNEKWGAEQPLFDLAKAILTIRENASAYYVNPDQIILCGFSAGGHLAASLGVHWDNPVLFEKFNVNSKMFKPNAMVLAYPMLDYQIMKKKSEAGDNGFTKRATETIFNVVFNSSNPSEDNLIAQSPVNFVSSQTPATFLWHTADDKIVHVDNSLRFASELSRNKVPFSLHVFESGVHGLSLSDETSASEPDHVNVNCKVWFDLASSWLKQQF